MLRPETIDDAVLALVASDSHVEALSGQELSHSELTRLVENFHWRPNDRDLRTSSPKGLVTKWLREREIPMHPRTRRIKFDDLAAAATAGRLRPTSHRMLAYRAVEKERILTECIQGLRDAVRQAELKLAVHERSRSQLEQDLEDLRAVLKEKEAEEQQLYDAGDRANTFTRLDPMRGMSEEQLARMQDRAHLTLAESLLQQ